MPSSPITASISPRRSWALSTRPVAHVALGVFLGAALRQFDGIVGVESVGRIDAPADVVEDEELGLGAEIDRVADTQRLGVVQRRLGDRARIAVVGAAVVRVHHVAEQRHGRLLVERVDDGAVQVRTQLHVGLVDRLPAGDGRAVEHGAVGQEVVIDHVDVEGHVLHLPAHVGEAHVDVFDFLFLDLGQDVGGLLHGDFP
jgi:hypothetical protein